MIPFMFCPKSVNPRAESISAVSRGWGRVDLKVEANTPRASSADKRNLVRLDSGGDFTMR